VQCVRIDYSSGFNYKLMSTSTRRQQIIWEADGMSGSGVVDFEVETIGGRPESHTSAMCGYTVTYRKAA
jgi:hypothetical protein